MAKSTSKNKKNSKLKQSIMSVLFFAFSLLLLFSLLNFNIGFLGKGLNYIFSNLFGAGAFFIVAILLVFSAISMFKPEILKPRLYFASSFIFLALLLILDFNNTANTSLSLKIKNALDLATQNAGSGIVGGFFGYIFQTLLGKIGTTILIVIVIIVCIIVITEMTLSEIYKTAKKKSEDFKENFSGSKQKKNKKLPVLEDEGEKKSDSFQAEDLKDEKDNSLPILNIEPSQKEIKGKSKEKETKKISLPTLYNDESESEVKEEKNYIKPEIKHEQIETVYDEKSESDYITPPLALLKRPKANNKSVDRESINSQGQKIIDTLKSFKIDTQIEAVTIGPTVTSFEISPPPGIKLSKIVSLGDNIALSLAAEDVRIEAPIPGKSVVGIEVPNKKKSPVLLSEIIDSDEFRASGNLPLPLGKDVEGKIVISSLSKMPHLLIAGQTGSGKSVCINSILISLLYKTSPEDVKLILIDPKVVELNVYNGIPHLLIPVVSDAKKASMALNWAVTEMEERYKKFAENHVRDMVAYNDANHDEKMPSIVIIIDELSDLMMACSKEVESSIIRLAQMARAAGIFLVIATQRPSVDVITGIIKANIPSRISFTVSSQVDSRTILDMAGAEKLLGKGDMLFYPSFYSKPQRIQGAFVSDKEVEEVVNFVKAQAVAEYSEEVEEAIEESVESLEENEDRDPLFKDAVKFVINEGQASISLLQRRLKIGYNRSANIVEEMERLGILSSSEGSKPRKVLVDESYLEKL